MSSCSAVNLRQPGTERQASAILIGGYNGEQRVCAFVERGGETRLDARGGRHRLTLQLRFAGDKQWMTRTVVDVELLPEKIPQGDGYFAPVVVHAIAVAIG